MHSEAEFVVLLNAAGQPVGTAAKAEVHTRDTPFHLAFSCYILNAQGQVLVTRRALEKQTWPGVWTNSVCGHPAPEEGFEAAVQRRARFELGLEVTEVREVLPDFEYRAVDVTGLVEWEKCPVFVAQAVGEPDVNPAEVGDFVWVKPRDLFAAVDGAPFAFSQWMGEQLGHPELRAALG